MNKIFLIIIAVVVLIIAAAVIYQLMSRQVKSISVDGEIKDVSKLRISIPINKEGALLIAKEFCNKDLQNEERFKRIAPGGIYGAVGELDESWFISVTVVNCICGVLVDKKTGNTACFYNVPSDKLFQIKY